MKNWKRDNYRTRFCGNIHSNYIHSVLLDVNLKHFECAHLLRNWVEYELQKKICLIFYMFFSCDWIIFSSTRAVAFKQDRRQKKFSTLSRKKVWIYLQFGIFGKKTSNRAYTCLCTKRKQLTYRGKIFDFTCVFLHFGGYI
jgi:hypothetical protein